MPADRANLASWRDHDRASGRNDRGGSWCNDGGTRRDDHGSGVIVAGTEKSTVTAKAASFACVGRRKR
jgi:hypothetical protein